MTLNNEEKVVLCSECFQNEGLRQESHKLGNCNDGKCPNCGSEEGVLLTEKSLLKLLLNFFVDGSRGLGRGNEEPLYKVFKTAACRSPAIWDHTLALDSEVIQKSTGYWVSDHGPRLPDIGVNGIYDDIHCSLEENQLDAAELPYGLRDAFDHIIRGCPQRDIPYGTKIYRIRLNANDSITANAYDTPPTNVAATQRFSIPGFPIFYGAFDIETCIHECKADLAAEINLATLVCEVPLRVIDLQDLCIQSSYNEAGPYLNSILMGSDYTVCQLLARRINDLQVNGFTYPSYFSPVRDKTHLNIALFGYPIRQGMLSLHSLNRVRPRRIKYEYTLGPLRAEFSSAKTHAAIKESLSDPRSIVDEPEKSMARLEKAIDEDFETYRAQVQDSMFDVEFPITREHGLEYARVTVTRVQNLSGKSVYSLALHLPAEEAREFRQLESVEDGTPVAVDVQDFDGDGMPEILVERVCGAHTHALELYRILGDGRTELVPGSDSIGSDASQIIWKDFDHDGKIEIVAKHRNWDDQECGNLETVYTFDGHGYSPASKGIRAYVGGRRAAESESTTIPQLLWTNVDVGIGTWKSQPVVTMDSVYIPVAGRIWNHTDDFDGVVCLDRNTGDIAWRTRGRNDVNAALHTSGSLFFGTDAGMVSRVDCSDGREIWSTQFDGAILSRPAITSNGLLVVTATGAVTFVDPETGRFISGARAPSGIVADPLEDDGFVYLATVRGEVLKFASSEVLSDDPATPLSKSLKSGRLQQVRLNVTGYSKVGFHASPSIWNDVLLLPYARDTYGPEVPLAFFDKSSLNCQFESPIRRHGLEQFGNIRSTPAVSTDLTVVAAAYGNFTIGLGSAGDVKWVSQTGVPFFQQWGSPLVHRETVYVPRYDGYLHALSLTTGAHIWSMHLGSESSAGAVYHDTDRIPGINKEIRWKNYSSAPLNSPIVLADGIIYGVNAAGMGFAVRVENRAEG